jgi:hypothetical protein
MRLALSFSEITKKEEGSSKRVHSRIWAEVPYLISILELELIQTQMTQKPMLRAEVYARALRASQNRKEDSL